MSRRLGTGLAALALALVGTQAAAAPAQPAHRSDPTSLVDPFVGTGSGGAVVGDVDTFPGATTPFGMVQFSPDTTSRPAGGGYSYTDSAISGFSLTHLSGAGCAVAGDIPFLPLVGALPDDPASATQPFSHANEQASPGSYAVTTGQINTRLTATPHTGLAQLTYPRGTESRLLVKVADSANGSAGATFQTIGTNAITGSVTSGHFCGQPDSYTVYFAATFSQPFTATGTWGGTGASSAQISTNSTALTARGKQAPLPKSFAATQHSAQGGGVVAGGALTFDTTKNPVVDMQVAISYVSTAGARNNLNAENAHFDLARTANAARQAWDAQLGKIGIGGGTQSEQSTFYTALYHSLLHPSLFSDVDGSYPGYDGKTHKTAHGHAEYSDFSGWDIYRSQIPLIAMLDPAQAGDMATSLLDAGDQMGWLPKWPVANGESGVMNGDAADPILAGLYAFGATGFDAAHAVQEMVHGATDTGTAGQGWYVDRPQGQAYIKDGYVPNTQSDSISPVPNGASETLEYALDDFAISRLAGSTGNASVARQFTATSQNWANLFNTSTGYIQPRDAQGAFPPGDPLSASAGFGQSGFQEGNAAQYTWMVPQNLAGLIGGMGGDAAARARLDEFFTQLNAGPNAPNEWAGNEPNLDTPWIYDSAGAPWETQTTVRSIMSQLYSDTPGGEPGNDDLGALSSWYVWAAMGVYPQTPGVPMLVVGTPLFDQVTVHAGNGRLIQINAPGAGDAHPYTQSLRVNGQSTTHTYLTLPSRPGLTRLDFTVGGQPDKSWGAGAQDAPPSFGAGPVHFPPSTRAQVRTDPAQVRLAPGGSTSVNAIVDNTLGTQPATVTWTATSPNTGITFSPSTSATTVAAGQSATVPLSVTASPTASAGFYAVTIAGKAGNGAILANASILVTVAAPGQVIPTAYVSNYSDNTVTPVDRANNTAGPVIPVGSGPDGVAVTPNGAEVYVANNNSNNVSVISTATNQVIATVPVGSVAADVAVTPDGKTVWVTNYGDSTVQPIDVATHTAGAPVAVGANPERDAISPDGKYLWIADQGAGTATEVDLGTGTVAHTVTVGAQPFGVTVGPDDTTYIGNAGSNTVSVVNASGTVTGTIALGSSPAGLAVSPNGSTLYVTVASGGVVPIATATNTVSALIATGGSAYAVSFSTDGATAWVVDSGANDIRPITVATGAVGASVPVGNVPDGIRLTP
jgi:predicted alpha-1,2-mannosidase